MMTLKMADLRLQSVMTHSVSTCDNQNDQCSVRCSSAESYVPSFHELLSFDHQFPDNKNFQLYTCC